MSKPRSATYESRSAASAKRAVLAVGAGRAREELVPGAEARARRIDDDLEHAAVARGEAAIGVARDGGADVSAAIERRERRARSAASWRRCRRPRRRRCRGAQRRRGRRSRDEGRARRRRAGARRRRGARLVTSARLDLALEAPHEAGPRVDPRLDGVLPGPSDDSGSAACQRSLPSGDERLLAPRATARALERALRRRAIEHARGEDVVAVDEEIGFDVEHVADDALDREAAGVDLGAHGGDDDAAMPVDDGARCPRRALLARDRRARTCCRVRVRAADDKPCAWLGTGCTPGGCVRGVTRARHRALASGDPRRVVPRRRRRRRPRHALLRRWARLLRLRARARLHRRAARSAGADLARQPVALRRDALFARAAVDLRSAPLVGRDAWRALVGDVP